MGLELILAIFVGSGPVFLAYWINDLEGVNKMIGSMLPAAPIVVWAMVLTALAYVFRLANRAIAKRSDRAVQVTDLLDRLGSHVASSLNTILQLMLGVIVGFHLLYLFEGTKSDTLSWQNGWLALFGLLIWMLGAAVRHIFELTDTRWQRKGDRRQ